VRARPCWSSASWRSECGRIRDLIDHNLLCGCSGSTSPVQRPGLRELEAEYSTAGLATLAIPARAGARSTLQRRSSSASSCRAIWRVAPIAGLSQLLREASGGVTAEPASRMAGGDHVRLE
jgi:hypothetical protein